MISRAERTLLQALAVGAGIGLAAGGVLLLWGFQLPLLAWALGGAAVALAWWGVSHLVPEGRERPREPQAAPDHRPSEPDRETRALHARLRGAASGTATTVVALHRTIGDLARDRAGDGPYPPALDAYLHDDPRPLSRPRLRTILRELNRL